MLTASTDIPQTNPSASYLAHKEEIDAAIARVLAGGQYILGGETASFEQEFASYVGVGFGVGVGSGTEALHLALRTCGVGVGDEVITVAHTAVATVAAIELCGATAVLVDIDPVTLTLDPSKLKDAITSRTKAIIPVHLYGHPAEIAAIVALARKRGLKVIEDCAQAHGSSYRDRKLGAWGDMGAFSFYPTKNLGAIGDAGIVVTSNSDLAARARQLREYGWQTRYVSDVPGWNTRLDELQAAILRVKLRYLDIDNSRRRTLAKLYTESLAGSHLRLPETMRGAVHVYHQYVVRTAQRERLREYLRSQGVGVLVHYPVPVHLQPAYRGRLGDVGSLPVTEKAAAEVLSLPLFAELRTDQLKASVEAIRRFGNLCGEY